MMRPLARRDGLLVRELGEETVVYDRDRHQAHCLNETAARVFRLCDGTRTPEQIAAALPRASQDPPALETTLVQLALARLAEAHLLAEDGAPLDPSRRELVRRVGLTAVALPAIVSVLAPKPAEAATCVTDCFPPVPPQDLGQPCTCGGGGPCGTCNPDGCSALGC